MAGLIEEFGKALVPKKVRPNLRFYLAKAGISEVPYRFFGIMFLVVFAITLIIFLATNFFGVINELTNSNAALIGILVFLFIVFCMGLLSMVIMAGIYFYINLKIGRAHV